MSASKLMPGDKVNIIGGNYVGRTAVILRVTKHMYQIRLSALGGYPDEVDVVRVMSWNVEKQEGDKECNELLVEIMLMRDCLDDLLDRFSKLHVRNGDN
jgi:ribosomal protein L24